MMYISFFFSFVFGALYFGRLPCIYKHGLLYIYDIDGSWMVFVVFVYGFMDLCLWIGVYGYVYGCISGYVCGCVSGYVFMTMCLGIGS
jgi:hypothetical protein